MNWIERKILFDPANFDLVRAVDEALAGQGHLHLVDTSLRLHPRGIRELTETRSIRLTRTMLNVLDLYESGAAAMERRLEGLQALSDELIGGLDVPCPVNTARVILQVIKQLVREKEDYLRRLRLAHDLRTALLGNPLFIRRLLKRYHLIEMPEQWEPVSFDRHVHDANTKGRKSPTHLIMDAWIKGIRELQVIYYNYVPRAAAEELLRAAAIMHISVRIGVEFRVLFRGQFVEMIWAPRGFTGVNDYLKFLDRTKSEAFSHQAREAAVFRRRSVLETLERFNRSSRKKLNEMWKMDLPSFSRRDFLKFVQYGQPSLEHIGEFLAQEIRRYLQTELNSLRTKEPLNLADRERQKEILAYLEQLSGESVIENWIDRTLLELPPRSLKNLPELNRCSPAELLDELHRLPAGFRMTLNLTKLRLEDVIEILYDCRGEITTLEIFNLKDELTAPRPDDSDINELRHALNSGAVIALKNLLLTAQRRVENSSLPDKAERCAKLRTILRDMSGFLGFYSRSPLSAALGSDSASRASRIAHGMGFVVVDTLTPRIQRAFARRKMPDLQPLPVSSSVFRSVDYLPREEKGWQGKFLNAMGIRFRKKVEFHCTDPAARIGVKNGNLATMGGSMPPMAEELLLRPITSLGELWGYLNSRLKIALKILIGFLAAFLTFYFNSHDWWVLVWFGAPIWLGITAVRNVVQSVLSGGGLRTLPLLKWNEFVSWQRVADSLFYTGLSVPLLDYLVKSLLLHRCLGWTAEMQPLLVFSGIALANGFYISGHNLLRAFPRSAVLGNWLRAPLSIPLAMLFNFIAGETMSMFGVEEIDAVLQQFAAITSKLASDTIGGVIEAQAYRAKYIAVRFRDYKVKLKELFDFYAELELRQPDAEVSSFESRQELARIAGGKRGRLLVLFYVNALDMMYFWMRQPRAMTALREVLAQSSSEERRRFLRAQEVLRNEKSIAKLFLRGKFGEKFSRALAFYLHDYREYLVEMKVFVGKNKF